MTKPKRRHDRQCQRQKRRIWRWYEEERFDQWPSDRTMRALEWFAAQGGDDYGYTGDWRERLEYCSDRMSPGRAKAILRLIKEDCD